MLPQFSVLDFNLVHSVLGCAAIVHDNSKNPDVDTKEQYRCKEESGHEG